MSKLDKFIVKDDVKARVQGKVSGKVYTLVNKIRRAKKLTWDELLEATFKRIAVEEE